ncbi:MAG: hypothetical protein PHV47_01895 [Candidatus Pacebacteria bacterium]|nr:hypothetical protein [Candidatus Paceibacterota bacterium]MDD5621379.1 hypothetical protein [Candidatus Paceibacterota bacterium]
MQKPEIKEKAIAYRKKGYSYSMISQLLNHAVSKSTLSDWLYDMPYSPNKKVRERINKALLKSAQFNRNKKKKNIKHMKELARRDIGKISYRDLFFLGLGLYLGEGTKIREYIRIINSDPDIIKLAIRWLYDACGLKTKNIRMYIHTYPDNDIEETINFWSKITKIPRSQFGKTQVDIRKNKSLKKHRKLPYGTAHITVRSCGEEQFGVNLHRRIIGWIEESMKQLT